MRGAEERVQILQSEIGQFGAELANKVAEYRDLSLEGNVGVFAANLLMGDLIEFCRGREVFPYVVCADGGPRVAWPLSVSVRQEKAVENNITQYLADPVRFYGGAVQIIQMSPAVPEHAAILREACGGRGVDPGRYAVHAADAAPRLRGLPPRANYRNLYMTVAPLGPDQEEAERIGYLPAAARHKGASSMFVPLDPDTHESFLGPHDQDNRDPAAQNGAANPLMESMRELNRGRYSLHSPLPEDALRANRRLYYSEYDKVYLSVVQFVRMDGDSRAVFLNEGEELVLESGYLHEALGPLGGVMVWKNERGFLREFF